MGALAIILTAVAGCSDLATEPADPAVNASVAFAGSAVLNATASDSSLQVGDSLVINVAQPATRLRRSTRVQYLSRDTTVVSVTDAGLVRALRPGKAAVLVRTSTARDTIVFSVAPRIVDARNLPMPLGPEVPPSPIALPPLSGELLQPAVATLPQRFNSYSSAPRSTRRIPVTSGAGLQAAIDTARSGDALVIASGVVTGPIRLRNRGDAGWVTILGDTSAMPSGRRVAPGNFTAAPRIQALRNGEPAVTTAPGASGYWFAGVEITASPSVTQLSALVDIHGYGSTAASVPSRIVFDRTYIHGTSTLDFQRCIALHAADSRVSDSYVSECHGRGFDSQAIIVITSPGPILIRNNYLEGAGENVMIGGGHASVAGMLPQDIEIVRNHFRKPLAWKGVWSVKNLFEIKQGKRIDVRENLFENNWVDGQVGFAQVIKAADQEVSWTETSDITFRHNVTRRSAAGVNLYEDGPRGLNRVSLLGNVWVDNGLNIFGGIGRGIQLIGRLRDIEIRGNTVTFAQANAVASSGLMMEGTGSTGIWIEDNAIQGGEYGVMASGQSPGTGSLLSWSSTMSFKGNVIATISPALPLPSGNRVLNGDASVFGYQDPSALNLTLFSSSPLRSASLAGSVSGARSEWIQAAIRTVSP